MNTSEKTTPLHTPRLCIDGRAEMDFPSQGLIAQELIDQLVASGGALPEGSPWVEKQRAVILAHPKQVFCGQLKRFDTRRRVGSSPLYWLWERQFIRQAHASVFHRFRPADRLVPYLKVPTVTTVLPTRRGGGWFRSRAVDELFVVPSNNDTRTLEKKFRVPRTQIRVACPTVRRYVHHTALERQKEDGLILLLMGDDSEGIDFRKLMGILDTEYPTLPRKTLKLDSRKPFQPQEWLPLLAHAKFCFYLTAKPFDWATLALETIFFHIPTLYVDNHPFLSETLGASPLRLSRFLLERPTEKGLQEATILARETLERRGCFEPLGFAQQFNAFYDAVSLRQ